MPILVTGSRKGLTTAAFRELRYRIAPHNTVLVGDALGLDECVRTVFHDKDLQVFYADWGPHGHMGGPIRNQQMVDYLKAAQLRGVPYCEVVAVPGPKSKGTWDCVRRAVRAGFQVTVLPGGL